MDAALKWLEATALATEIRENEFLFPWVEALHVLAITVMGLHLLDYLQFEDLAPICEAERRWSFLCSIAPLRLPAATGSPVNPIAVL